MTSGPFRGTALAILLTLVVGCHAAGDGRPTGAPPPTGQSSMQAPPVELVHPRGFRSTRDLPTVAAPDRIRIPAIGVDTGLDLLSRLSDGTLQVPPRWGVAGWYQQGPKPGEPGPAAVLGHVDSPTGPAVFARLRELRPGDVVLVDAGPRTLRFRVTGTEQVPKDRFPTQQVYLPTLERLLRMITCGGSFDHATGHYTDNVIVSAALVS